MTTFKEYFEEAASGMTKANIKKKILNALTDWMDLSTLSKELKLPMSDSGIQAHVRELVAKGKVRESMKKGKPIWITNTKK